MAFQFSLAHLTVLSSSPMEMIHIAQRTGYDFVSLRLTAVTPTEHVYALQDDPAMLREVKAVLADTGVRVLDIELARLPPETEPGSYAAVLETAAELGARHILAQLPDPDRERATRRFAQLCDMALPLGLTVDLEYPSWTETPNLRAAAEVVRAVNRPNAGVLIDTLHFNRSRDSVEELRQLPRSWFHFAQVCDAPAEIPDTTEGLIHTARSERELLGEGGIDVREILDALPAIPYSLEIPNDARVLTVGAEEHARRCIEAARRYLG
jgi:sugar phosphate isomerase/epimerase